MFGTQPTASPSTPEPGSSAEQTPTTTTTTTEPMWKPLPPQSYGIPRCPVRKPVAGGVPRVARRVPVRGSPSTLEPASSAEQTPITAEAKWKPLPPQSYGSPRCPVRKPVAKPAGVVPPLIRRLPAPLSSSTGAQVPRRVPVVPGSSHRGTQLPLVDTNQMRLYWDHTVQEWRRIPALDRDGK